MTPAAIGLPSSRVYAAKSGWAFYQDVAAAIGKAESSVLIVDAYMSRDFFERYVSKMPAGVTTRILTNGT
jgi:hypothetical protein